MYLELEGLEKFTDALKLVPGLALESWLWLYLTPKLEEVKNSGVPFSPV